VCLKGRPKLILANSFGFPNWFFGPFLFGEKAKTLRKEVIKTGRPRV